MKNKKRNCKNPSCCPQPGSVDNPVVYNNHYDEYNLIHKRNKFELWADKYNHTLEVVRTVAQLLVLILQLIIIWRIF